MVNEIRLIESLSNKDVSFLFQNRFPIFVHIFIEQHLKSTHLSTSFISPLHYLLLAYKAEKWKLESLNMEKSRKSLVFLSSILW